MDTWVQVNKFEDGDSVNAETLNTPIDQLSSRTEYLKRKLASLKDDGFQSALVLSDVGLDTSEADKMSIGSVVYLDGEGGCKLAQAKMHLYDNFTADETAFTIGVLIDKTDKTGDVLIYGKLDIGDNPLLTASGMLQSGEVFRAGRYYLSAIEPGKITANPSGPMIYVGSFHSSKTTNNEFAQDAVACINPQFMDIGTSHVHRAYPLVARPAGHLSEDGKTVIGYLPDNHLDTTKRYPSLIFGGTWTQKDGDKVVYRFTLSESSEWGNVKLQWAKDGRTSYKEVEIPAPEVFVDLDNGLKVKVLFPNATSSNAFSNLSDDEREWTLTFPAAGKGWLNYSASAVASEVLDGISSEQSSDSTSSEIVPKVKALVTGKFNSISDSVYISFPEKVKKVTLSSSNLTAGATITIKGVTYKFVSVNNVDSVSSPIVPVVLGGDDEETCANLAYAVNKGVAPENAKIIIKPSSLIYYEINPNNGISGGNFKLKSEPIKLMAVYDSKYNMIGSLILENQNKYAYSDITLTGSEVHVYLYAEDVTENTICKANTVLKADIVDACHDAIYEYAMGLHQSVDYYFPPVPAQSAGLFVNGVEMENSALFPDNPTYTIGRKTIYWMEDDAEHLPWPAGITGHDDPVLPSDDKTMAFYFTVGFQGATGPVTSIVPAPNSPLKIYTYGTKETAYTGDLEIDAAFDFKVNDANIQGYNVAKQGSGGELLAGPVVEKILAGNGLIIQQAPGCPAGQGTVTISLADGTIKDHFNEIALENAKQEKIGLFPYISLLGRNGTYGQIPSAFTMMMRVPTDLRQDKNYKMQLRLTMFGSASYSADRKRMAGVSLEYNILPDFTGDAHNSMKSGLLSPAVPRQINVPLGHNNGSQYEYVAYDPFIATTESDTDKAPKADDVCVEFSSIPIPSTAELPDVYLKPGYLVAIRISRVSPTNAGAGTAYDEYFDPLGFLSMEWYLEEA